MKYINKFLTFHPYLTYSGSLYFGFVKPDGKVILDYSDDTIALYYLGKKVYERLPEYLSKAKFDRAEADDYKIIATFRKQFIKFEFEENSFANKHDGEKISAESTDWVINTAWKFFTSVKNEKGDDIKQIYIELYLHHALRKIDHAITALDLSSVAQRRQQRRL